MTPTEFVKKPRTPLCPNCGVRLEAGFGDGKDGGNVIEWFCGICLTKIPTERVRT